MAVSVVVLRSVPGEFAVLRGALGKGISTGKGVFSIALEPQRNSETQGSAYSARGCQFHQGKSL